MIDLRSTSTTLRPGETRRRARAAGREPRGAAGRGRRRRRDAARSARGSRSAARDDGWHEAELGPLPEGVYRVTALGAAASSRSRTSSPCSTASGELGHRHRHRRLRSRRQRTCTGAVRDALRFRDWLLDPNGGNVPPRTCRLAARPRDGRARAVDPKLRAIDGDEGQHHRRDQRPDGQRAEARASGSTSTSPATGSPRASRTARRARCSRPDFTSGHTDQSLAVRSLAEFFETTQFEDQFFFIDACRNVPPGATAPSSRSAAGRSRAGATRASRRCSSSSSTRPRRAAGGRGARRPGEEHGAFTDALMDGLRRRRRREGVVVGAQLLRGPLGAARRLRQAGASRRDAHGHPRPRGPADPDPAGRRQPRRRRPRPGRACSPRSPRTRSRRSGSRCCSTPTRRIRTADVRVLNALGDVVAGQVGSTGQSVVFYLPPGTYALRAAEPEIGEGRAPSRSSCTSRSHEPPTIALRPIDEPPQADAPSARAGVPSEPAAPAAPRSVESVRPGTIPIDAPDPLSIVEVTDEAGRAVRGRAGSRGRCSSFRPASTSSATSAPSARPASGRSRSRPARPSRRWNCGAPSPRRRPSSCSRRWAATQGRGHTVALAGCEPIAWAADLDARRARARQRARRQARDRRRSACEPPRRRTDREVRHRHRVYLVSETGARSNADSRSGSGRRATGPEAPSRCGRSGEPRRARRSAGSRAATGSRSSAAARGGPWSSPLTVLDDWLATIVLQITKGIRLFQYQPATGAARRRRPPAASSTWSACSSRADSTAPGSSRSSWPRRDDPFVGCLCGYVLLRLGLFEELRELTARLLEQGAAASDAFVLLGEHAAATRHDGAKQAFAEAVAAGVPVFAEGLTRLLEGLRAHDVDHPRGRGRPLRLPEPHARLDVVGLHPAPVQARDAPRHGRRHRLRGIGSRRATGSRTRCIERGGGSTGLRL